MGRHAAVLMAFSIVTNALGEPVEPKVAEFNDSYAGLISRYPEKLSFKELAAELQASYDRLLKPECAPERLAGLNDDDLKSLFRAVATMSFYSRTESDARDLGVIFSEAGRRKLPVSADVEVREAAGRGTSTDRFNMVRELYNAYMRAQLIDEARRLTRDFPAVDLPAPPTVVVAADAGTSNRVYDFGPDGGSMTLRAIDWDKGPRIVMVFAPHCGFSQQALADIGDDASLLPVFQSHALLLGSPNGVLDTKSYAEWNEKHPSFRGYISHSMGDWPQLDLASTPQFYFFSDGKLVSSHGGWKGAYDERMGALLEGMRSIGLSPVDQSTGTPLESRISSFNVFRVSVESRYPDDLSFKEFADRLGSAYKRMLKPACRPELLKGLRDEDLREFFQAVDDVAFYSEAGSDARDLGLIFAEAERRKMDVLAPLTPRARPQPGAATYESSMAQELFKIDVRARLFPEARRLAGRFPSAGLPPVPEVTVARDAGDKNRVFYVADDGRSMTLTSADWRRGPRIIAVFSPTCGFSRRAVKDIEGDAALLLPLREHGLWIAPPGDVLHSMSFVGWNKEHPEFKGAIAYTRPDWPGLELSATPQFYFYKDGKLMAHTDGWLAPAADRKAELAKGLASIGLAIR